MLRLNILAWKSILSSVPFWSISDHNIFDSLSILCYIAETRNHKHKILLWTFIFSSSNYFVSVQEEDPELFPTQVDEEVISAAQARQTSLYDPPWMLSDYHMPNLNEVLFTKAEEQLSFSLKMTKTCSHSQQSLLTLAGFRFKSSPLSTYTCCQWFLPIFNTILFLRYI